MKDFREEQNEYKTKIEEKIAKSSDHEMVGILKGSDLDLNIKNESPKSDCVFDLNSQTMSTDIENQTIDKEFNKEVEIPEKVEKLYAELVESKKKHESILKFFVATEKVTDSDVVK